MATEASDRGSAALGDRGREGAGIVGLPAAG